MNIQAEKLELIERIIQVQNEEILHQIKELLSEPPTDWWEQISEAEQKVIEIGLQQANQEEGIPHQEAMKQILA